MLKDTLMFVPSQVSWRANGASGSRHLPNPVAIEMTKACYEFNDLPSDLPSLLGKNATLQIKALTNKAVRFDHVIWHRRS